MEVIDGYHPGQQNKELTAISGPVKLTHDKKGQPYLSIVGLRSLEDVRLHLEEHPNWKGYGNKESYKESYNEYLTKIEETISTLFALGGIAIGRWKHSRLPVKNMQLLDAHLTRALLAVLGDDRIRKSNILQIRHLLTTHGLTESDLASLGLEASSGERVFLIAPLANHYIEAAQGRGRYSAAGFNYQEVDLDSLIGLLTNYVKGEREQRNLPPFLGDETLVRASIYSLVKTTAQQMGESV